MPLTPRAETHASAQYQKGRRNYLQKCKRALPVPEAFSNPAPTVFSNQTLIQGPAHSLRKMAHEIYEPFQAYGIEPSPELAQTARLLRVRSLPDMRSGDGMEQHLKEWMSQSGISLRAKIKVPAIPHLQTPNSDDRRSQTAVPGLRSSEALGEIHGKRRLVNCPVPSAEYLSKQLEKDSQFLPVEMMGQTWHRNCPRHSFSSVRVQVSEDFHLREDPLAEFTRWLSKLSKISKLQIEEMRRRWWRDAPLGTNDVHGFLRVVKQCGVDFVCQSSDLTWSLLRDIFEFLDVRVTGKIDFTDFVRAIGVFVLAEEPLHHKVLVLYRRVDQIERSRSSPGDCMSRRDLQRVNMRMQLARVLYGHLNLTRDLKRVVSVQVSRMMQLLNSCNELVLPELSSAPAFTI